MVTFTKSQRAYLSEFRLGRLATVGLLASDAGEWITRQVLHSRGA